jgi:hypothetical protein
LRPGRSLTSAQRLRDQTHRERVYRPLQFHERSQHFIRVHNETLSVTAMRVNNPDRSPRWNQSLKHSPNSNRLC